MAGHGKKYLEAAKLVERDRLYAPDEAAALAKQTNYVAFDGTVEAHLRLGVDPRHADQMVRGTVVLPHGTGKVVRVAVFAQGDKAQEALRAGADEVGGEDLVKRIEAGWLEFDVALATPDSMGMVGRLGKILGRRGLRSEEHTSELQSLRHLVCRLLLEKKKQQSGVSSPAKMLTRVNLPHPLAPTRNRNPP